MDNIIFTPKVTEKPISYPCLRKDVKSELIVLFMDRTAGIAINASKEYRKGVYHDTWVSANDPTEWIPIHGTVSFKL